MAKQVIDLGTPPGGSDGDTSRTAFTKTNVNFDELYARVQGKLTRSIAGAAGVVSLTESEALNGIIDLTGVITGNRDVTVDPSWKQAWIVRNSTTGAFKVTFKTTNGSGVEISSGASLLVFCDGSKIVDPIGPMVSSLVAAAVAAANASEIGKIDFYARSTAPTGYLKANGACVPVASYPGLTASIYCGDSLNATALFGYRCDNADGTGRNINGQYLKLPDLRGEFLRAWDDGRGIDVNRLFASFQAEMVGPHSHVIRASIPGWTGGNGNVTYANGNNNGYTDVGPGSLFGIQNNAGTENRVRNVALLACIRAI